MRMLSISGMHNGTPMGCVARHYDEGQKLPARYLAKKKPKPKPVSPHVAYRNHVQSLSDEKVYEIRASFDRDVPVMELMVTHKLSKSQVYAIGNRKCYGHLPERKPVVLTDKRRRLNDSCQHFFKGK